MLTFQHQARLANAIIKIRQEPFRWSYTDCNAFVCRCIDAIKGRNYWEERIRDRYQDERGALVYVNTIISPQRFLEMMGYDEIIDNLVLQTGDIILAKERHFMAAHIYFDGALWSAGPQGVVSTTNFTLDNARVFRWDSIMHRQEAVIPEGGQ